MKDEFRVLSIKEEEQLSLEERCEYYKELREYVLKRKLTNTTPGATTIAPKLTKPVSVAAKSLVKLFTDKNVEWMPLKSDGTCDERSKWQFYGLENVPSGPVIFAHTHQGLLDNFAWMPITNEVLNRHCLILHSIDARLVLLLSQFTTGLILVKKGNKKNNNNAKLDMMRVLLEGKSIIYSPESAWNLSPNKLHLPLSYGLIDLARKTNTPIIPVVLEYSYDTSKDKATINKIDIMYGKPIFVNIDDNLFDKLHEYEESISTMRYDFYEKQGIYKRHDIDNQDYIKVLKEHYNNLILGKIDVNRERKYLFSSNDEFYKFHHINDVPFDKEGNLLETEEVRKIKTLNKKHNI